VLRMQENKLLSRYTPPRCLAIVPQCNSTKAPVLAHTVIRMIRRHAGAVE
jgi:hypothetical protein